LKPGNLTKDKYDKLRVTLLLTNIGLNMFEFLINLKKFG